MSKEITSAQVRGARALLGWSGKELADQAGVGVATIRRVEALEGIPAANASTLKVIMLAMESCGIEFTGDPLVNPGVVLNLASRQD